MPKWLRYTLDLLAKILGSIDNGPKPSPTIPDPVSSPSPSPSPSLSPEPPVEYVLDDAILYEMFKGINEYRASEQRSPLKVNELLVNAAMKHSEWQAANNKMSHTGEGGSRPADRIKAAGYSWVAAGENVAMGFPTAESVVKGWWNSPGHKANMLGSYVHVGVGYAKAANGRYYWTSVFASPRSGAMALATGSYIVIESGGLSYE